MTTDQFPENRLHFFQEKLNLARDAFDRLLPYSQVFVSRADDYVAYFMEYFTAIHQTKMILDRERRESLARVKRQWFVRLFEDGFSKGFQHQVWRSGVRHVEINLDMRYVNLAYAMLRQFCHGIIEKQIPEADRLAVASALDKVLDFCVLMATDSFIASTTRCDLGVIQGIAHQVRNPVTVIGGSIKRLKEKGGGAANSGRTFDMVLSESQRLERMLNDVGVYSQLFASEAAMDPVTESVGLPALVDRSLKKLAGRFDVAAYRFSTQWGPGGGAVAGRPEALATMFYYLLENALEAMDPADPRVEVRSCLAEEDRMVEVAIFNTGQAPAPAELDNLWSPFASSKPMGTGFGLPIAEMVARRHLGWLNLKVQPGRGVTCLVRLPAAEMA